MRSLTKFSLSVSFCIFAAFIITSCDIGLSSSKSSIDGQNRATFTGYIHVAPSPTGNDATGTGASGSPYATLAKAASVASMGKTIKLAAGTYNETQPAKVPIGVSIEGAGVGNTLLQSSGVALDSGVTGNESDFFHWPDGSLIQLVSPIYSGGNARYADSSLMIGPANGDQTLSGFSINGNNKSLKAGIWVENRSNVTVHSVNISSTKQTGAVFSRGNMYFYTELSSGKWMQNITVYNMTLTNCGSITAGQQEGALKFGGIDGGNVYNITINDTAGQGIKFAHVGHLNNFKLHDSTISLAESAPVWDQWMAIELWNLKTGVEVYNITCNTWISMVNHPGLYANPASAGTNLKIYNVRMVDNDGSDIKEALELAVPGVEVYGNLFQNKGFGAAIWDAGGYRVSLHNNVFYNTSNLAGSWGATGAIFIANSTNRAYSDIKIYNNVFDKYSKSIHIENTGSGSVGGVDVKNNAFLNVSGQHLVTSGSTNAITFSNNLTSNAINVSGVNTQSGNVQSATTGVNASGDRLTNWYKPSSASAYVVDKGTNVGLSYSGASPDIGAFEWGGATTTTTTIVGTTTTTVAATTTTTLAGSLTRYEAEAGTLLGNASVASDHPGYSGTGFLANFYNSSTAGVQWNLTGQTAGNKTLNIRYAAGLGTATNLGLYVNNTWIKTLTLPGTSADWNTWATVVETITLVAGNNSIKIVCTSASTACENLDFIEVSGGGVSTTTTTVAATTTTTVAATTTTTTVAATTTTTTVAATTTTTTTVAPPTTTTTTVAGGGPANGTYKIVNKFSNKAQKTNSYTSGMFNATYDSTGLMKWTLTKVGAFYKMVNVSNGYAIKASEWGGPDHETVDNGDDELFSLTDVGGGYYKVSLKLFPNRFWRQSDLHDGNGIGIDNWSNEDRFKFQFLAP